MKTILFLFALFTVARIAWADPTEQQIKLGYQMQTAVLKTQDVQKVQQLLDAGVDINAPIGCGTYGPLDGAVQTQNVEMVKYLLSHGAKPRGHELADAAFANGHQQALEMVEALLQAGVSPNSRNRYSTALIEATYRENKDVIKLLLSQPGTKLDEPDVDGYTALMCAVKHGSSEIIDFLLHAGASTSFTNQRGETAATIAQQEIEKQHVIIAKLQSATK